MLTAIPRTQILRESENGDAIMEPDPLLEIKHIHYEIDRRAEWFKRHGKVGKDENKQNQVASCVQKSI